MGRGGGGGVRHNPGTTSGRSGMDGYSDVTSLEAGRKKIPSRISCPGREVFDVFSLTLVNWPSEGRGEACHHLVVTLRERRQDQAPAVTSPLHSPPGLASGGDGWHLSCYLLIKCNQRRHLGVGESLGVARAPTMAG